MKHGTESYHVWSLGHEKEQAYIRAQRTITTDVLGSISEVDDPLRIAGCIHPYNLRRAASDFFDPQTTSGTSNSGLIKVDSVS
jgi:hypothetical protein